MIETSLRADLWEAAIDETPAGWFGPAVEPRWPNRWRAWYRHPSKLETIDCFAATEEDALAGLVAWMRSKDSQSQ